MKHSTRRAAQNLLRDIRKQREEGERHPKDAVLHLRIERETVKRIKAEAKARQMSVSDLVRRHLAEHFPATENKPERPAFLAVTFAWADVVVAQETRCAKCAKCLPVQSHGWMAQGPPPPTRILCGTCYDQLETETYHDQTPITEEDRHATQSST